MLGLSTGNLHGNLTGPLSASKTCLATIAGSPAKMPMLLFATRPALLRTWVPLPKTPIALPWLHASRMNSSGVNSACPGGITALGVREPMKMAS